MEKLTSDLDVQLKLLAFTQGKTKGIVDKGNREAIERHRDALRSIVKKVGSVKTQIEEAKLESGVAVDELSKWSDGVEAQQETADEEITYLSETLVQINYKTSLQAKKCEEELAERDRDKQLQFERAQLEQKLEFEKKIEEAKKSQNSQVAASPAPEKSAKLPKLVITKFRGELTDWPRFWSQFEAEIDKAEIAGVTKYSYLKELVDPKIRTEIDGLPYSSEGYERAKNILARKYGQTSEVVNAYVENIMSLPTIGGTQPARIHDFYEKLLFNVQSLETMGKLREVTGYVRMTIDKLPGIRGDLVRTDDSWREWKFPKLVDELRKWTERNLIQSKQNDKPWRDKNFHNDKPWRDKNFQAQQQRDGRNRGCVYCEKQDHKSVDCKSVTTVDDRRKVLSNKRLCFNCTGTKHRADDCKSLSLCQICQRKHHTSICNSLSVSNQLMTATSVERPNVIYPVVVVEVLGVKCRALLDTGAGSSYASAALLDRLKIRPHQREVRQIEMMMGVVTKPVEIFKVQISSLKGDFLLETDVTLVNKKQLLSLENPRYQQVLERYGHLKGVKMDDMDTKDFLPVHLILGVCDYTKIKTETAPLIGAANEPIAEKTKFGWTIISPGKEVDLSPMFLTQTSTVDYDNLCRLDVLGLADSATGDQDEVYSEFKEQLSRDEEGWYETSLPWKGNHPSLPSNEAGSLRRLTGLVKKLRSQDMIERYDQVIQEQIKAGIVERVSGPATGQREFYIPHKAVVRDTAETTKLRVVYDASARAHSGAPSLNECLNPGPPLQNKLWSVLVRSRFHPVAVAGDIKQAFLQVRIKEQDRDALRFHWLKDPSSQTVETLRFTRALFGLTSSPFLLGGVIQHLLESCRQDYPDIVSEIERSLYVDDLISGGPTSEKAKEIKSASQSIFAKGTFELHKWHSNVKGHFPVYLPDSQRFTEKLITQSHLGTLHGGVVSTMAKVRELYWVPRLRRLTKRIVKSCHGCRRFQAQAFSSPPQGDLPKDRTEGQTPFQVVGVDYAGPLKYRKNAKTEGKAYVLLYACSLTRALFLDLLPNLETKEFLASFKNFIARRGRPEKVYSDNGRTFVGAAQWIKQVMQDEKFQNFLAYEGIQWQFNLSRAPWWGGQFERMVGLVKGALHKCIGNGLLSWAELQEVLLDIEVALNNRPLSYVDEDIQLPILTPSSFLFGQPNMLPELEPYRIQEHDLRKRAKYLRKCKDTLWSRWTREYLRGLRERHRLKHSGEVTYPSKGEVVIIKSEEKNRAQWKLGVVEDLITGRDGVIRGAKLKTGKSHLERPIQHLYPLELSCDKPVQTPRDTLNADAPVYRPRRDAAAAARFRIQDINENEQ